MRSPWPSPTKIIVESENPVKGLKYRTPATPIRPTPTFEQFKQIVDDIRGQRFNADAGTSADFVEFIGRAAWGKPKLRRSREPMSIWMLVASSAFATKPIKDSRFPFIRSSDHCWKSFAKARSRTSDCLRCTGHVRQSPMRASGSDSFVNFPMGEWSLNSRTDHFGGCSSLAQWKKAWM